MSEGSGQNVGGVPDRPLVVPQGPGYARARELLGRAVRVRREKCKLTQAQAAQELGVSRDTVIRWEKGEGSLWTGGPEGTVDYAMMAKLRTVYGAKWDEIMPRNQYPSAPLDPARRREYFIRRNAQIQGFDPDEAVREILGRSHETAPKGTS
jgi:transcriptional regulator with XRE-family HTH domain